MLYKFIWGSKTDRVSRQKMVQSYRNGGCKMIHLNAFIKSLKLTWFRRLLKTNNTAWKDILLENNFKESCLHFGSVYFETFNAKMWKYFLEGNLWHFTRIREYCIKVLW